LAENPSAPAQPDSVSAHYAEAYDELRRLARGQLARHQRTGALDTTALVHESFMRFAQSAGPIADKRHFMGYAAKVMRSVIVDFARARNAEKRGGDLDQTTLNSGIVENVTLETGVLKIDEALDALSNADPRLTQIVELRFFAGLSVEEAAEVIGVSERTLFREWEKARLILLDALREPG
jgi:RNA polymerase sigma factor (TIGR02999 family)